jgi:hypothetical protein
MSAPETMDAATSAEGLLDEDDGVVSLAALRELEPGALAALVRNHGRLAASGRRLRVVDAQPQVAAALRELGLGWLLHERHRRADAPGGDRQERAGAAPRPGSALVGLEELPPARSARSSDG